MKLASTLLLLCGSALGNGTDSASSIPVLADDFSSTIESVIDNKNYSMILTEVYDQTNDRLRIDRRSKAGTAYETEICDLGQNHHYKITKNATATVCTTSSTTTDLQCLRMTQGQRHLSRASEWLERLNSSNAYVNGPTQIARGIQCDTWKSENNVMGDRRGRDINITYSVEWFFQVESWNHNGAEHGYRIPVLVLLTGYHVNTTTDELIAEDNFTHHYNFLDYHPTFESSRYGSDAFAIHSEWNCAGHEPLACGAGTTNTNNICEADSPTTPTTSCGQGSVLTDGVCVCADSNSDSDSDSTSAAPDDGTTNDGNRRLLNQMYDTTSSGFFFLPMGLMVGYFFYGAY